MKSFYETFLVGTWWGLTYTETKKSNYKNSKMCSCFRENGDRDTINLFNYDKDHVPSYNKLTIIGCYLTRDTRMRDIDFLLKIKLNLNITYEEI